MSPSPSSQTLAVPGLDAYGMRLTVHTLALRDLHRRGNLSMLPYGLKPDDVYERIKKDITEFPVFRFDWFFELQEPPADATHFSSDRQSRRRRMTREETRCRRRYESVSG
ncbi:hypothetical protein DFH11DRAFT_1879269 [Phellopilus nigrolimitatus]|nr:hypothetical protein DFH11DRAFT_1879269 [Phellopilus nigrolimitatus]